MLGIVCDGPARAASAAKRCLERGVILLPSGDDGTVLSITPPLVIGEEALFHALDVLIESLR